jgi:hypothetical protein
MRPIGGWALRALTAGVLVFAVAGCGGGTAPGFTGDPTSYLVMLDQLNAPGYTVYRAATHIDATALTAGDASAAAALATEGLQSAATVEYQRTVDFGTSNGPVDIASIAERFAGLSGATSAYRAAVQGLDAIAGAVQASTGPLGDQAHSISVVRTTSSGLQAVEITVLWRVNNVVNVIVVRGRYGGTRLEDALVLASLQTLHETGGATP